MYLGHCYVFLWWWGSHHQSIHHNSQCPRGGNKVCLVHLWQDRADLRPDKTCRPSHSSYNNYPDIERDHNNDCLTFFNKIQCELCISLIKSAKSHTQRKLWICWSINFYDSNLNTLFQPVYTEVNINLGWHNWWWTSTILLILTSFSLCEKAKG